MLLTRSIKHQPHGKIGDEKWQCNEQLWRKKVNCCFALFKLDFMIDNMGIMISSASSNTNDNATNEDAQ
jgi:hypothetical protein